MAEKPTTTEPKRRWWQFRTRTLLIGTVLLGVPGAYVIHEATIVADRNAWIEAHPYSCHFVDDVGWSAQSHPGNAPSLIRRWLDDRAVSWICVPEAVGPVELLFPEAAVAGL
jgi:hypothetical protein